MKRLPQLNICSQHTVTAIEHFYRCRIFLLSSADTNVIYANIEAWTGASWVFVSLERIDAPLILLSAHFLVD